jgi:hypothetical protein
MLQASVAAAPLYALVFPSLTLTEHKKVDGFGDGAGRPTCRFRTQRL